MTSQAGQGVAVALHHPAGPLRLSPAEGQKIAQLAAPGSYLAMTVRHCMALQDECAALTHRVEQLEAALKPLAGIPIEEFGWESSPDRPITGWNKHALYVRDVLAARAARTGGAK